MIPYGYKQTEIGIIPEDWEIDTLKNVGDFFKGSGISMRDVKTTGFPCIMYGDIYVKFDTHFKKCDFKIDKNTAKNSTKAISNDLFFTASGETAEEIGKCVSYQGENDIYIGGDIIAIRPNRNFDSLYLAYVQNSEELTKQKKAFAQGHTVVHINKNNIASLIFAYPNRTEQEKISTALYDIDNLILSLEKLIEKKKAIKQGAMQELLAGKKRLPGFKGEWMSVLFKDIYAFAKEGGTPSTGNSLYYYNGKIPFIKIEHLSKKYIESGKEFITEEGLNNSSAWLIPKGSIIFSNGATIGEISINKIPVSTKQGILGIVPKPEVSTEFLYYYFSNQLFLDNVRNVTTHGTMDVAYLKDLNTIKLIVPKSKEEQTAIALVLSNMDNEIEALEQKLAKTKLIKQGMMQQLLTGKIRLVDSSGNEAASNVKEKSHVEKKHNHQFDDAVMIAGIVNAFYTEKYPLGRKKVQKLLYLLRRKQEADTSSFKKKAAGPYADEVRYKGGEPIAKTNRYVQATTNKYGTNFSKGEKIQDALDYIEKWETQPYIDWLLENFQYTKTNDLELYATIDMAICDLKHKGIEVSVDSIKNLIASNKEWKEKLSKTYFSDKDIARAIMICKKVL